MNPLEKKIPLVECFGPTIQGEGAVIGQQTYFLRFGLCDYRCKMCDSMHAVDPVLVRANAQWLTQDEIFTVLKEYRDQHPYSTKWVTFSGGNPCVHNLEHLCARLHEELEMNIAVETQGTRYEQWLWHANVLTISPKGPGMGEQFEPWHLDYMLGKLIGHRGINFKVVVFGDEDIVFADSLFKWLNESPRSMAGKEFYLSQGNPLPPGSTLHPSAAAPAVMEHVEYLRQQYLELADKIMVHPILCDVKFLPQFHVWLHGNKQGV